MDGDRHESIGGTAFRPAWFRELNDKPISTGRHLVDWIVRLETEATYSPHLLKQLSLDLPESKLNIHQMADRKYFSLRGFGVTQRDAVESAVKMIKGYLPMFQWSDLIGGDATQLPNSIDPNEFSPEDALDEIET